MHALAHMGSLVVRTSWLFSATHDSFVSRVVVSEITGRAYVVDDQSGSPTAADDLAVAVLGLIDEGMTGLVRLAGRPWFSH